MADGNAPVSEKRFCCLLCQEKLREPVSFPCGHSFCRDCSQRYQEPLGPRRCPLCRLSVSPHRTTGPGELPRAVKSRLSQREAAGTGSSASPGQNLKGVGDLRQARGTLTSHVCAVLGDSGHLLEELGATARGLGAGRGWQRMENLALRTDHAHFLQILEIPAVPQAGMIVADRVPDVVRVAVGEAVMEAVRGIGREAVSGVDREAVREVDREAVGKAVGEAVKVAVKGVDREAVRVAVRDAMKGVDREAVKEAVKEAVRGVDRERVWEGVRQVDRVPVRQAVKQVGRVAVRVAAVGLRVSVLPDTVVAARILKSAKGALREAGGLRCLSQGATRGSNQGVTSGQDPEGRPRPPPRPPHGPRVLCPLQEEGEGSRDGQRVGVGKGKGDGQCESVKGEGQCGPGEGQGVEQCGSSHFHITCSPLHCS
ncbi:uncharacterized protein LOC136751878 [Amia ocellicauda]|uniref:uncharacterized protein LOC136751878 n=1 Tax=Amia ocellicauda TaxID=2972642 RepID=UPI003464A011